ncbi:CocE/NonD family hydrolase [Streptomyces brevispora]|uniref:CocE/NonD family hydrolase n=1 Tax=Streptomyces brevispora TaxID=887462 RepID=UPI002E368D04|nr:CocE/NonD family hydrolase [Streptomyces brevispora]
MSSSPILVPATPYDEAKEKGHFSRFDPGTRTLKAGFRLDKHFRPLPVDIVFDKDVAVELRDGTTLYVDVFRPAGSAKVPVIMAWSPYGKSRGAIPSVTGTRKRLGIDNAALSGLMKWEGPDPAYWVEHGYAVCNPDARGACESEGDVQFFGEQEGRDAHDVVEWLAAQDWCSGKVGMSGNSYLAISQWFTAAEQPPHLAAIAPWEGMSDIYRDNTRQGGIPDPAIAQQLMKLNFIGRNRMEDGATATERYPLMNDYWRTKIPRFDRITVPAYVVASYTNTIHTPGTFRAWRSIASPDKWLRIHNSMEWPDYYAPDSLADLKKFFDHYLKGQENGWQDTPRVRYSLLDLHGHDVTNRPAAQFPPDGVEYVHYHLDASASTLDEKPPAAEAKTVYDSTSSHGQATFTTVFHQDTEIVGYPKANLWVEADGADDMDLFVFLQKLDTHGRHLEVLNVHTRSPLIHLATRKGASVLKYKAAPGRLRVSMRHLDPDLSTEDVPVHSFDRIEKLTPGQIVPVEIPLFPLGLLMRAGEQLRLVVAGRNLIGGAMPVAGNLKPDNHGRHIIHTGPEHDSFLRLPVQR